jgi:GDP-4-dehydro-6-deoxy-D-mannose reductase
MSSPRSVLITGASGFVGRHLLPALRSAFPDTRLIPTSRRSGGTIDGLSVARLDLDSAADIRAVLDSARPDAVIHLSGIASTRLANDDPAETWRANVGQAVALAESVRSHVPDAFFVFVSSASIYGASAASGDPVGEDAALLPADVYGRTKAEADQIIGEMAQDGLRAVRLRPFNHTGPGQSAEYLVPTMARQIARIEAGKADGSTVQILSRNSARDYLDVRDVCAAYVEALRRRGTLEPGTALNIASGRALSVDEIFASLRSLARTSVELVDQGKSTSIPVMRGDASKARLLLGWEPKIAFAQTLADTLDWWRGEVARGV